MPQQGPSTQTTNSFPAQGSSSFDIQGPSTQVAVFQQQDLVIQKGESEKNSNETITSCKISTTQECLIECL